MATRYLEAIHVNAISAYAGQFCVVMANLLKIVIIKGRVNVVNA